MLKGTKKELVKHFVDLTKNIRKHKKDTNTLYSSDGFNSQLNEIEQKINGSGIVFYLEQTKVTRKDDIYEINLELKSSHVYISSVGSNKNLENLISKTTKENK